MGNADELKEKLRHAINYCSAEGLVGDMPDFIAADLVFDVLCAVGKAVKARDEWYGFKKRQIFQAVPQPLFQQDELESFEDDVARDNGGHGR